MPQNNLLLYCRGHAVQECSAKGYGYANQHTECKRRYDGSPYWLTCYNLNGLARVQQSEILLFTISQQHFCTRQLSKHIHTRAHTSKSELLDFVVDYFSMGKLVKNGLQGIN